MRRITRLVAVLVVGAATGCTPELSTIPEVSDEAGLAKIAGADQGGRPLTATLTGAAEAPGPGDPDGSGTALITLNQGQAEVCFELTWADIETPTRAHIHRGAAGVPGGIVVHLYNFVSPPPERGCVASTPELIQEIRQNPEEFYVNIHNAVYPAGAIRGQL